MRDFTEVLVGGELFFVCDHCGCLVSDTDLHRKWHRLPSKGRRGRRTEPISYGCNSCDFEHEIKAVRDAHEREWHGLVSVPHKTTDEREGKR